MLKFPKIEITRASKLLVLVNIGMFILVTAIQELFRFDIRDYLATWPIHTGKFFPTQLITNSFIHIDESHLLWNMLFLLIFIGPFEKIYGFKKTIIMYILATIGCSIASLIVFEYINYDNRGLGASGALNGFIAAFLVFGVKSLRKFRVILTYITAATLVIPGIITICYNSDESIMTPYSHIGGFIAGLAFSLYLNKKDPQVIQNMTTYSLIANLCWVILYVTALILSFK